MISQSDPARAVITPFATSWKNAGKSALTTNNAIGYSSARIVVQALRGGGQTAAAVYSFLRSGKDIPTPMLTYNFGKTHNGTLPDRGNGWFAFSRWNPTTKAFELTFDGTTTPAGG